MLIHYLLGIPVIIITTQINMEHIKYSILSVALIRDEKPFTDEWILHHRMLGIKHSFYNNDTLFPLAKLLNLHVSCISITKSHSSNVQAETSGQKPIGCSKIVYQKL